MNNKFTIIIISILIGINIYTCIQYYNFKSYSTEYIKSISEELEKTNCYKSNFTTGIKNSNYKLRDSIIKDSTRIIKAIQKTFFKNNKHILVCRFSDYNCESCISNSIQTLLQWSKSIGKNNILFLGSYKNSRNFNKLKKLYGIDKMQVANTIPFDFPAEDIGYPYYFILDNNLNIYNLFVPQKGMTTINNRYIELIKEVYF